MTENTENNNGAEATPEVSDLEKKIIRQIEYYFGDINLGRDKFLLEEIKKEDGWVPMETMLKFNRLKNLSEDTAVIIAALKKSTSGLMEVNEDDTKIRRSPDKPIPEFTADRKQDLKSRSVYAKGFPLDETLDDIEAFFDKFGQVEHIFMRKDDERKFKGSVFVLFEKVEIAEKFLKETDLKYKDNELKTMFKDDYFKMKTEERKKKKEEELVQKEESKKEREEDERQKLLAKITKSAILSLEGLPDGVNREDLKEIFGKHCNVAWVDFNIGDKNAHLRFDTEGGATLAFDLEKKANDGKIKIKDTVVEGHVLEGDDELEHWRGIFQSQKNNRESRKRRGGGRPGRRGGFQAKRAKTESGDD